jgi:anti-anti-sigma factor
MDRADLRVSVAHDEEETVVSVSGELDVSTADHLAETVNDQLRDSPGRIVVDLAGLDFCDSLGLGTLVVLSRTARVQQTYLVLRNPSPFVTRMLEVTGVGEGLNIAQD